jgi:beta-phosphoglucomutase
MKKFKAFIFDMDGVVVDTNWIWDKAFEELFKEYNKDFNVDLVRQQVEGLRGLETVQRLIEIYNFPDTSEKLHSRRMELMNQLYATNARFVEGFLEFKSKLNNYSIQVAIATNAYKSSIDQFDGQLKVREVFGGNLFSVDELNLRAKPFPDIYLYTAEKLAIKPEESIVIEDSASGIQAAKQAGMFAIALATSYSADSLKTNSNPDLIVNHFSEIDLEELL